MIKRSNSIKLVEVMEGGRAESYTKKLGYGRDPEEARANAGLSINYSNKEYFRMVTIRNSPSQSDDISEKACSLICNFHIYEDTSVSPRVKNTLLLLVGQKLYAYAVQFCFKYIWDKDW